MGFDREKLIDSKLMASIVNDVAEGHKFVKDAGTNDDLVERLAECAVILAEMTLGVEKAEIAKQQLKPQSTTVIM
jgi:hypothetical protein